MRTLGCTSKPLKSLCSSLVPSVSCTRSSERDLVLDETAAQLVVGSLRVHREDAAAAVVIRGEPERRAPDELVARQPARSAAAGPRRRCAACRGKPGRRAACNRSRRAAARPSRPAAAGASAPARCRRSRRRSSGGGGTGPADDGDGGHQLADLAGIGIALDRPGIARARIPVGAKPDMRQAPGIVGRW